MNLKKFGVAVAAASLVMFPLAACGSSPAPVVTTVTATPSLAPCPPVNDPGWERCFDDHRAQRDAAAKQPPTATPAPHQNSGLPWWAWTLIVPGGLAAALVLGFKVLEWNDERTISRAQARVDELDARPRPVVDYDDYEDDDLDEDDMSFLHQVTDPAPSAPAAPVQPAAGNLLSSLRQQGGVQ
ncbi:hypothetical protein I3U41_05870 [Mycobacteroides abscessus subsp. abscessus]|uniref:hypothetical protein n=1 Tax=Mycobacteroides abscessus TaxID=36809 RepID=UPI0019D11A76|nr:hypothetical protein [Mycobacteroides abscessus]QSN22136.1 hypothetical protein I3U41_05870 [Mycobacteroides abscessus subsp. abscessus]